MDWKAILLRVVRPLASRKIRLAIATVAAAYVGKRFDWSEEQIMTVLTVGTAVILGVAIEDHGTKTGQAPPTPPAP